MGAFQQSSGGNTSLSCPYASFLPSLPLLEEERSEFRTSNLGSMSLVDRAGKKRKQLQEQMEKFRCSWPSSAPQHLHLRRALLEDRSCLALNCNVHFACYSGLCDLISESRLPLVTESNLRTPGFHLRPGSLAPRSMYEQVERTELVLKNPVSPACSK